MSRRPALAARSALWSVSLAAAITVSLACGFIGFQGNPAAGYVYGSGTPLRVAVVDETGDEAWSEAIAESARRYADATPYLLFQSDAASAHIVVTVRRYTDTRPPQLEGYAFQPGVTAFAAVYDSQGVACSFPPHRLPRECSGELARAEIYLNDSKLPGGAGVEDRRIILILHELGHALGLTRHSADLGVAQLALRYGWGAAR